MKSDEATIGQAVQAEPIEVEVVAGRLDRAVRQLKRRLGREGIASDVRRHRSYVKPSVRKREKRLRAARRRARLARRLRSAR